jgi:hypothetical protein
VSGVQDAQEENQVGFSNWILTHALPTDLRFADTSKAKVKQVPQAPKVTKVSSCGPSIAVPADKCFEADYCRQKRN